MSSTIRISFQRPDKEPLTLDELSAFVSQAFAAGVPGNARLKGFTGRLNSIETDAPATTETTPQEQP